MPEMMKAALIYGQGDLRFGEAPKPEITHPDDVLIRVRACGICPSDLRAYTGTRGGMRSFPYVPGHEWAGEVVAVGEAVTKFTVGDRVVPSPRVTCGKCYYCTRGIFNYCENLERGRVRGGFAQYGVALEGNLFKIPDHVSFIEASFCEPLACCINGSLDSKIGFGEDTVIVGAGPIGLMHLQLAKIQGARVIVSEFLEERLAKAKELGADELICAAKEDPVERVKELTEGRGANTVIVAVGAPKALMQALDMAGINAYVNYFAGTYPPTTIPLDPNIVHYKQLRLTGSHDYNPPHFRSGLRFVSLGMVKVMPLVSHLLKLEDTKEGFDIVAAQKGLKVVVETD